jgi:hypothetical protein
MRPSQLALVLSASLALAGSVGCAADPGADPAQEQDQTSSLIKTGTYVLSGAKAPWTIKQLVLKPGGQYVVVMYPGAAFPIADVKTTTGKYTTSGDTLTIKFTSGNVFESWQVTAHGGKFHFHDRVESSEFDMTYVGADASDPAPEPLQGKDPGLPAPVSGGLDVRCHSSVGGDVWANLSIARSGIGRMNLSSKTSLELSQTEKVTLAKEPGASSGWLLATGDGNKADGKRYTLHFPTSFLEAGGKDKAISMTIGSQDPDNILEESWGLSCSTF